MKILLVEDNRDLALNITEYFENKNYTIDYAADGPTGLNLLLGETYDVVVLDVMLPGMDGFRLCEQMREHNNIEVPVIMLTARDREQDKLKGFSVGADDYLIKPFSLPELEARLHALVRRASQSVLGQKNLVVADLVYNPATMSFKRGDVKLSLKPVPRKILVLLMQKANHVVTRQELEQEIWHDDPPDSEVLRSHIYAIRSEINKSSSINLLHTIRGTGYILGETEF
ncbi:MAG: response regulator transcription factor [Gammaproteobacteria bacterium]|jgi:DNA-binding response OmpR family regulator|nr:response regulator transcription factor [Gammaproteobacteria bacterium]